MILQALKEYYDRKAADPDSGIAPEGFELKEIPFILVLTKNGKPVDLMPMYEGEGKNRRAKKYFVPKSVKRSSGVAANLLWDNPEYALGVKIKTKDKRLREMHEAFKQCIRDLKITDDEGIKAVMKFLDNDEKEEALARFKESLDMMKKEGANLTFKLADDEAIVCNRPAVEKAITEALRADNGEALFCLVAGKRDNVERLHPPIKGVWGAQTTGANIVSFNLDPFKSYGKVQGANSPVGKKAAFAYTTALNDLLGRDSKQRMQVGDASTVFWSEKETEFEKQVVEFFGEPPKDDPDRNVRAVQSLFRSPQTGTMTADDDKTRFYVLGLSPNASRIAVRFWVVDTVASMAGKIRRHFDDLRIVHGPKDMEYFPLFRLLVSLAVQGKADNIPPNLAGDTMRAILEGFPYPQTLLGAAIRRIHAEREVTYYRAALIKACLNRANRIKKNDNEKEITVGLDINNTNIGYRLGRLFATLEKIQQEANPGINATIRDKFYGAASSTPVTVFGNLMRLKNHHLAKLENKGRVINLERLIGEIMDGIADFPPHLTLENQGRFAIGYYHQMQDFYIKKSDNK
ncbi:type I-C CRISPR-associated protein Cas8c/Csd1 [candidate division TA06 bacterium]|uniref:Type I-C CRISPR-associated protein Cas8c/Csd1 n=1 Tax=candidate division TA06 bacterium TaxID=2250710 RepID=A0A933MKR1_UNCT6|nr:type I-C CRISPR-associated protein Cas8c/Csd1 [candidate division TA06 bacterium]